MMIIKNHTDTKKGIKSFQIQHHKNGAVQVKDDFVAVEEPLEICMVTQDQGVRFNHPIAVTMRTPGYDSELALGFLLSEGVPDLQDHVETVAYGIDSDGEAQCNRIEVLLKPECPIDLTKFSRHVFTSSSCGICGKITIEQLENQGLTPLAPHPLPNPHLLQALPGKLREKQAIFQETGGLHAAALFDHTGELLVLREDVGRHNAMDKVLGFLLNQKRLPASQHILLLSGRASFELIQKAIAGGISCVASVGAPSSLAVDLAKTFNINLVGFLKANRFNCYNSGILPPTL